MKTAVLGGGISGLCTAYYLQQSGIPFSIFENSQSAGVIQSEVHEGTVLDWGPNTIRDRSGIVNELIHDLALQNRTIKVDERSKTRCIVRNGTIHFLRPSILSLIGTRVLSLRAKLRVLAEPFISEPAPPDESLKEFMIRRIGEEATEYLADSVFSGIYAGDLNLLSKYEVLGEIAALEEQHGSLFKALRVRRRENPSTLISTLAFDKGIQVLTDELRLSLKNHFHQRKINRVEVTKSGYLLYHNEGAEHFDRVISCIPAYALATLLGDSHVALTQSLQEIYYPPVLSTQAIFEKTALSFAPEAFGFLIPRKEGYRMLGAIWKSTVFPQQTAEGYFHINILSGGAHDPFSEQEAVQVEKQVLHELKDLMNLKAPATFFKSKYWKQAIPQFDLSYADKRKHLEDFESRHPHFYIGGNFRWGVSIHDCITGAKQLVRKLPS